MPQQIGNGVAIRHDNALLKTNAKHIVQAGSNKSSLKKEKCKSSSLVNETVSQTKFQSALCGHWV